MSWPEISRLVLLLAAALLGCVTDLWKRRIPDFITWPALGAGLVLSFVEGGLGGAFDRGLVSAVLGGAFCGFVFGMFYLWNRGMGAGDVKLMAALGALSGFSGSLGLAMCVGLSGAALALVWIVASRRVMEQLRRLGQRFRRRSPDDGASAQRLTVPYGLAILAGAVWGVLVQYGVL